MHLSFLLKNLRQQRFIDLALFRSAEIPEKILARWMFDILSQLRKASQEQEEQARWALRSALAMRQHLMQGAEESASLLRLHQTLRQEIQDNTAHPFLRVAWAATFACPRQAAAALWMVVEGWDGLPWQAGDAEERQAALQSYQRKMSLHLANLLEDYQNSHTALLQWLSSEENRNKIKQMIEEQSATDPAHAAQLLLRAFLNNPAPAKNPSWSDLDTLPLAA